MTVCILDQFKNMAAVTKNRTYGSESRFFHKSPKPLGLASIFQLLKYPDYKAYKSLQGIKVVRRLHVRVIVLEVKNDFFYSCQAIS